MTEHAHAIEPLVGIADAVEILGMSKDWVYEQAAAGTIPSYKFGSIRKFRASELEAFIQGHAQGKMASVTTLGDRRR